MCGGTERWPAEECSSLYRVLSFTIVIATQVCRGGVASVIVTFSLSFASNITNGRKSVVQHYTAAASKANA